MTLYELSGFSYTYYNRASPAVSDIGLAVDEGEFVLICGKSGCGKSTLLSCMKNLQSRGTQNGNIRFCGADLREYPRTAQEIGYAAQLPDEQTVTDTVWHELAFGAENIGMKQSEIRARIAEVSLFFGIEKLLYRKTDELSGGQKQIINLASLLVLRPRVLILDEPLSQLDPIAAEELTGLLGRINRELGIAVVIAEHRLSRLMELADKMIVMDGGKIIAEDKPQNIPAVLDRLKHPMLYALPCQTRAAAAAKADEYPLSVKDGKAWYRLYAADHTLVLPPDSAPPKHAEKLCSIKDIYFSYGKNDVLRGLSLDIYRGELLAVSGGNAAGKSTLLSLVCGSLKPASGSIRFDGKPRFGFLPQNPALLFSAETVREELESTFAPKERIESAIRLCRLGGLLDSHPLDLSGGERQRAALAKLFAVGCDLLLLDEPTKGLDAEYKSTLSDILVKFCQNGGTAVLVSHDNDFCAENANRCAVLFGGQITCCAEPREFYTENIFYTTDAAKVSQDVADGIFTARRLIESVGGKEETPTEDIPDDFFYNNIDIKPKQQPPKKPLFRKTCTVLGAVTALAVMVFNSGIFPFAIPSEPFFLPYLPLIVPVVLLIVGIAPKNDIISPHVPHKKRRPAELITLLATAAAVTVTVMLTLPLGGGRLYLLVALLILVECFIPFIIFLENKKPAAKDIAAMAVMCAAAVAGRELFFMLPQFKPTAAIVIIAAAVFGAQPGFIIGTATMLVSNMLFGQGTWTVWQMLAMGLTAFFAGLLFSRRRSKTAMCIYGFAATLIIYGGIMNITGFLTMQSEFTADALLAYLAAGLPFDIIHATATAVFILLLSGELVKRLDRVTAKYGLFA
ncbi:MAG: ATP-binding cassette domain-containing protein [Eubacterium sp.]|nr:ATP-binding cassette domain-containing protein [Eubacterium sp.]